jgi:hypothetical protein
MIKELKRIIADSEVMKEDDHKWPKKNVVGKQELEIRFGNEHVSFEVKTSFHAWRRPKKTPRGISTQDIKEGVEGEMDNGTMANGRITFLKDILDGSFQKLGQE